MLPLIKNLSLPPIILSRGLDHLIFYQLALTLDHTMAEESKVL